MGFGRLTPPFRRRRGGQGISVTLSEADRLVVADLLTDVARMLDPEPEPGPDTPSASDDARPSGPSGPGTGRGEDDLWAAFEASVRTEAPSDPAVARLLPDGHRDDEALAQGFRRLTEHTLRERKSEALRTAAAALRRPDPLVLEAGEGAALLRGLTDLRLVLAERLGIRADEDAEALHRWLRSADPDGTGDPEADRRLRLGAIYESLTWWQESLVWAVR